MDTFKWVWSFWAANPWLWGLENTQIHVSKHGFHLPNTGCISVSVIRWFNLHFYPVRYKYYPILHRNKLWLEMLSKFPNLTYLFGGLCESWNQIWLQSLCSKSSHFSKINFYWSIVTLKCCISFYCTGRWMSYTCIYICVCVYIASLFWISFPFRSQQGSE